MAQVAETCWTLTQGGMLTQGTDTHLGGTFTQEETLTQRRLLTHRGTLTQEDTAGHARDALDLGDVVVEEVLVAGSAVCRAVAEDAPERGGR